MFAVFNIISTGNDLNAGSTTSNTAAVTDVGGTYTQGGGAGGNDLYTASAGTPFSGTSVGEYVSIYTAGATITTFVGQVTAVNSGGASIDISLTIIYGTRPANASTKTAKTGGAWASPNPFNSFGTTSAPQSTEIDIKAGTYAQTINSTWTMSLTGTTTKLVWYRGYISTVGDLEPGNVNFVAGNNSSGVTYPTISFSGTGSLTTAGAFGLFSGLAFTSARSGPTVNSTGSSIRFWHCRFSNTSSNSAAAAISSAGCTFVNCYFTTPSTASQIVTVTNPTNFSGCYFDGTGSGSTQVGIVSTSALNLYKCTFNKVGSHGITQASTSNFIIVNCSFNGWVGGAGDAIRWNTMTASNNVSIVTDNDFFLSGGFDLNNNTGSNTANIILSNNHTWGAVSGHLNAFGDAFELNALSDSSDPRTNATDLHLISTSAGANKGSPGQWENLTTTYVVQSDTGAWQRTVPASGLFPAMAIMSPFIEEIEQQIKNIG